MVTQDRSGEPRDAINGNTDDVPPFWGKDVNRLTADRAVKLASGDRAVYGYPISSLSHLPPGRYRVQALMNVYETFHRADGADVTMHLPCGDGNVIMRGTGNVYSKVHDIRVRAGSTTRVDLELSKVVQPAQPVPAGGTCQQGNFPQTEHVKQVKIKSRLLSRFWGRPIYIAASVLLPRDYASQPAARYPVVYQDTHFPTASDPAGNPNPFGFREQLDNPFSRWWVAPDHDRAIAVNFRHENVFYDTSCSVNSENVGPCGDAIVHELMPEVDRLFRTTGAAWARTVTGGSTAGWQAMGQQVYYPKEFGGDFSFCSDVVDFRSFYTTNLYRDDNLYWRGDGWLRTPRPEARDVDGSVVTTNEDWNHYELALGTKSRSGQYMDMYAASYGPKGRGGHPVQPWDKRTGTIDHEVVEQWRHYDLRDYVESNWTTLAPDLQGQIHHWVGEDDSYHLENAVKLLEQSMTQLDPAAGATFEYGAEAPHCWDPFSDEQLVQLMVDHMAEHAPAGTDISAWRRG